MRAPSRRSRWLELGGLAAVVALAAFLRFWRLGSAPGWEWDEPNYASIATNLGRHGELAIKHDVLSQPSTYFFHPPFYFLLLAGWFRLVGYGITEARVLTAFASLVLLALCYLLFRRRIGMLALVPVLAIACDGWLVFSDRVSWFDHVMLVIGVAGLLVYELARDRGGAGTYVAAGALLGAATVFKHLGAYFVLAVALHWLLAGGWRRGHALLLGTAAAIAVAYVATMLALFGRVYWDASTVQFRRASGTWNAGSGSVGGTGEIWPVLHQYRLFYATIAIAVVGGVVLAVRLGSMAVRRTRAPAAVLGVTFSWLLAAIVFFGALQIRYPQYFMLVLVPLYGYVAIEVVRWASPRGRKAVVLCVAVLVAFLAADGATFVQRIANRSDNALRAAAAFANTRIPPRDVVVTEQPIGVLIRQPYCERWRLEQCLARGARWVIDYRTELFTPEKAYEIPPLTDRARRVARFEGFKETITVYELPRQ